MAKIIGNTTATPNPRPDWNQTDASKADYIKNKPLIPSVDGLATENYVDTKVAEVASGKITKTIKTQTEIEDLIANPSMASTDVIYMVKDDAAIGDTYKEYTLINNEIVQIGDTSTDLSDYYNKTETNELLDDKADKSTTLAGYGITDAYTKSETDNLLKVKADVDTVYTKAETDALLSNKADKPTKYFFISGDTLTLANNTTYYANSEISSLTVIYPDTDFICSLEFTLASEGDITITLPTSKYIGGAPTFANGETWELNIKNKVVVGGLVE